METLKLADSNAVQLVVEVLDARDRVVQRERVWRPLDALHFKVGRSIEADIMLDDPHVAAVHAEISVDAAGAVYVTDLGSVNGVVVAGRRHKAAAQLLLADQTVQIGRSRIRVRVPGEALPAEREDRAIFGALGARQAPVLLLGGSLLCIANLVYGVWLDAPTDLITPLVVGILYSLLVLGLWSSIWSLLTRVMQGEWRWLSHAALFLTVMGVLSLVDFFSEIAWFSLNLPGAGWREPVLMTLAAMCAIYLHLAVAAAIRPGTAALASVLVPLLIAVPAVWMVQRSHTRDVNYIAEPGPLFPAPMRLRGSTSLDEFMQSAAGLQAESAGRRDAVEAESDSNDD